MINVPNNVRGSEFDLYISGFKACEDLIHKKGMSIQDAIDQVVNKYGFLITDCLLFENFLKSEITVFTEPSITLVSPDIDDKTWWNKLIEDASFRPQYWQRYKDYLNKKPAWSLQAVQDIDDSTNDLMNCLANPRNNLVKDRMGMVFGYVQSGKTAHYLGLMNKAVDAGYRIVIVLTGIHNSLRSQTQSRIDEEVLGYETSLENIGSKDGQKNAIGVGIGHHNQVSEIVQSITTRDDKGDVNAKTEGVTMMPPFVIVTKKNASVLRRILRYFKKSPYAEVKEGKKYIPAKYPALIIDDEADQASINTRASYDDNGHILDDYNPTTINGLIRELLMVFQTKSYVGYTATPFANIFIPPKLDVDKYGKDLYPRDFIMRSPRASQYVGAREFFGLQDDDTARPMPLCEEIISGAGYLSGAKADDPVGEIPEELKKSIKYFLISTALRNCRGQRNKPNTMLVHIVRFVKQQNAVKKLLKKYYEEEIANYILYADAAIKSAFQVIWENDYLPKTHELRANFPKYMDGCTDVSWEELWAEIVRIVRKKEITIYSVNGKSDDALLYKNHENEPFNVIVVGGDKLSRGLTLEGLTVSYFTRSSNTYDTLMQMGRWFGFRPGYLDACRLFTTRILKANFRHISMATEDLAGQFEFMTDIAHSTPMDFGLRVATHPDLEITSKNKLRTGQDTQRDFSCKLSQTRVFDIDPEQYDRNFFAVETLLQAIQSQRITAEQYSEGHGRVQPGSHFFWEKVSGYDVANFFENYETSRTATRANSKYMADYVRKMNSVNGVTSWTVCLMNIQQDNEKPFDIAYLKDVGAGIYRGEDSIDATEITCSIHTMTSAGHEYYDYTQDQMDEAGKQRIRYSSAGKSVKTVNEFVRKETRKFNQGLLLLYPIANAGALTSIAHSHCPFGFAAVFPDRKGKGDLQSYRMTEIALEKDNDEFYN